MVDFKQFDIVSDHSDHHYSNEENSGDGDCFVNHGSTVYKKIMHEWKILENGLPDTIYVRVYEKRIDLMRAAIVGAAGTPYRDGLFFFDIKFPPNYPDRPPHVHYRSHGLVLGPNLSSTGSICLSLLNTGFGWRKERWVPSMSTILQVLVSLQGLVLIADPSLNDWTLETHVYSLPLYVFIQTCKSTVYLLRDPPKNFEGFVAEHFRSKASDILRAYIAYAHRRLEVGHYYSEAEVAAGINSRYSYPDRVPEGLKGRLEKLYPILVQAFKNNGFSEDWVEENLILKRIPFTWPEFWSELKQLPSLFSNVAKKRYRQLVLPCLPTWAANDDDDDDVELSQLTSKDKLE